MCSKNILFIQYSSSNTTNSIKHKREDTKIIPKIFSISVVEKIIATNMAPKVLPTSPINNLDGSQFQNKKASRSLLKVTANSIQINKKKLKL